MVQCGEVGSRLATRLGVIDQISNLSPGTGRLVKEGGERRARGEDLLRALATRPAIP